MAEEIKHKVSNLEIKINNQKFCFLILFPSIQNKKALLSQPVFIL